MPSSPDPEAAARLVALCGYGPPSPPSAVDAPTAELAALHGLDALLGARIDAGELEATDSTVARRCTDAHRMAVARMLALGLEADSVARLMADAMIPVMAIKGFAVAHLAYRRPTERTMADLDVLVPPGRRDEACRLLLDEAPERTGTGGESPRHFGRQIRTRRRLSVDVHRALANWPQFDTPHAALFARARPGPHGLLYPDPNDLMVILAIHHARNGMVGPLRVVVDGLALAGVDGIAPEAVVARAEAMAARRATGAWLSMLVRHGLEGSGWSDAARALMGRALVLRAVSPGPTPPGPTAGRVGRSLLLTDGTLRRLGWLAGRGRESVQSRGAAFMRRGTAVISGSAVISRGSAFISRGAAFMRRAAALTAWGRRR
jgi:hypothetical protein